MTWTETEQKEYEQRVAAIREELGCDPFLAGQIAMFSLGHAPGDNLDLNTKPGRDAYKLITGKEPPTGPSGQSG